MAARGERGDRIDAPGHISELHGEGPPALSDVGAGGFEQAAIPRQLKRARKQNLRNRFSALDPPLQLILLAARQAPGEEIRLLWHRPRRERLELVADHTVGVEEG